MAQEEGIVTVEGPREVDAFCPRGWAIKISIRFPRELSQPFHRPSSIPRPSSPLIKLHPRGTVAHGTAEDPLCYNFL